MPYTLILRERPAYLHVTVSGDNSPETVRAYLREVLAACIARGVSALLIEEHLDGPPFDLLDVFRIASEESLRAKPQIERLAWVDTNPDHPHANMQFAENVAVNRGLHMRVFPGVAEAEEWMAGGATAAG